MSRGPKASGGSAVSAESRLAEISAASVTSNPRAVALAAQARADGLVHPMINYLLGCELKRKGRLEEAITELGEGLRLDPNSADLTTMVGFCLLELDRRQEAARVFQAAMELDPRSAQASYGYGWTALRLGALAAAESGFQRAVDLDPKHADALAGLSGLALRRSDWETARTLAKRAVALDPRQTDALMNLARIDLGVRDYDAAERRLNQIIALPHLKPLARADARIMLGDALDGAGRHRQAYAAYKRGKAELQDRYAAVYAAPGVRNATDGVRAILAEFLDTPEESWAGDANAAPSVDHRGHAFLAGFPRSGTTLLEQVLAAHPDVVSLEERPVMLDAETEFLTQAGGVKRLSGIVSDLMQPYRESYWRKVREFGVEPAGKVFIDKHPLSTVRLPLIAKVFPNPSVIFALRDPRDVVLSCFRRSFNMNAAMYQFNSIETAAEYYDAVMTAGQAYMDRIPMRVHPLRYEDLVANFESTSRDLCAFLGVEWNASMADFAQNARGRAIATPSSTQVARGLYVEGVNQWRNYAFALEPVMPILAPWVERFGYAAE